MKIGIPKETADDETRVAAVPDTVAKMTKAGMEVLVETGAGAASYMRDEDYIKAGAKVIQGAEELFKEADVILKVQKPLMNDRAKKHEIDMMREGVVLITFLQPMANLEIAMPISFLFLPSSPLSSLFSASSSHPFHLSFSSYYRPCPSFRSVSFYPPQSAHESYSSISRWFLSSCRADPLASGDALLPSGHPPSCPCLPPLARPSAHPLSPPSSCRTRALPPAKEP